MPTVECHNASKVDKLRRLLSVYSHDAELLRHKALANGIRLNILHVLDGYDCCVCDLSHALDLSVATVSQHLKILKEAGLVKSEKVGKFRYYSANCSK